MPISILFWVVWLICLVFAFWGSYDAARPFYRWGGGYLAVFILLGILGWRVFGSIVQNGGATR